MACLTIAAAAAVVSLRSGNASTPTNCRDCDALNMVWCYHDNTCYPHGSATDRQSYACPGTTRCVANDCDCKSCDDRKCQPAVPNAAECHGWTCNISGQYCPPNVPGSSGDGFCCEKGAWVSGICTTPNNLVSSVPTQVHLAYGSEEGQLTVSWVTNSSTAGTVTYREVGDAEERTAAGDSRRLNVAGDRWTHVATLNGISEGAAVQYSIAGRSTVFNTTYHRSFSPSRPSKHVIFGDMGAAHGYSLCLACTGSPVCNASTCATNATKFGLIAETDADMFLHVGDFAYNFDTNGGELGDQFMDNIEQVASQVPYMVSHGNHEDTDSNLAHYIERFRGMPSNAVPSTFDSIAGAGGANTLYYSWDAGLVHYIALSTELWFGVGDSKVNRESMLAWLESDLKAANANRAAVPWIIAHGHRDIYCSTSDDSDCDAPAFMVRKDLEPLFYTYGVDLWINGHEHSYERTYPLYKGKSVASNFNPPSTIYIVTGAAGSPEMHEGFDNKQPTWSAYRSNTFGYSRLTIHNASHVYWEQVQTDPTLFPWSDYGRVIDSAWFVQFHHGPFDPARAPRGTAFPEDDESPERSYDHWEPLLKRFGVDDGSNRAMCSIIRDYKKLHGDIAFAKIEDKLLQFVNGIEGGNATYEDVRHDGSSSGSWLRWKGQ